MAPGIPKRAASCRRKTHASKVQTTTNSLSMQPTIAAQLSLRNPSLTAQPQKKKYSSRNPKISTVKADQWISRWMKAN